MIPLSLRDVATLTGGSLHPDEPGTAGIVVTGPVVTDSRQVGPGSLYVARVGEHADGHRFVGAARDGGAVAALTSHPVDELPCVVVDDVQAAFGRVARGVLDVGAIAGTRYLRHRACQFSTGCQIGGLTRTVDHVDLRAKVQPVPRDLQDQRKDR